MRAEGFDLLRPLGHASIYRKCFDANCLAPRARNRCDLFKEKRLLPTSIRKALKKHLVLSYRYQSHIWNQALCLGTQFGGLSTFFFFFFFCVRVWVGVFFFFFFFPPPLFVSLFVCFWSGLQQSAENQGISLKILENWKKYWQSQGNFSASNSENPVNMVPHFK